MSSSALDAARAHVTAVGGTLGEALVAAGTLNDDQLTEFYCTRLLVPKVNPNSLARLNPKVIAVVPADMAIELRAIPVSMDSDNNLTLAMSDPSDRHAVDEIAFFTGAYIVRAVATQMQIAWCLAQYYGHVTHLGQRLLQPTGAAAKAPEPIKAELVKAALGPSASASGNLPRTKGLTGKVDATRHRRIQPMTAPVIVQRPNSKVLDDPAAATPNAPSAKQAAMPSSMSNPQIAVPPASNPQIALPPASPVQSQSSNPQIAVPAPADTRKATLQMGVVAAPTSDASAPAPKGADIQRTKTSQYPAITPASKPVPPVDATASTPPAGVPIVAVPATTDDGESSGVPMAPRPKTASGEIRVPKPRAQSIRPPIPDDESGPVITMEVNSGPVNIDASGPVITMEAEDPDETDEIPPAIPAKPVRKQRIVREDPPELYARGGEIQAPTAARKVPTVEQDEEPSIMVDTGALTPPSPPELGDKTGEISILPRGSTEPLPPTSSIEVDDDDSDGDGDGEIDDDGDADEDTGERDISDILRDDDVDDDNDDDADDDDADDDDDEDNDEDDDAPPILLDRRRPSDQPQNIVIARGAAPPPKKPGEVVDDDDDEVVVLATPKVTKPPIARTEKRTQIGLVPNAALVGRSHRDTAADGIPGGEMDDRPTEAQAAMFDQDATRVDGPAAPPHPTDDPSDETLAAPPPPTRDDTNPNVLAAPPAPIEQASDMTRPFVSAHSRQLKPTLDEDEGDDDDDSDDDDDDDDDDDELGGPTAVMPSEPARNPIARKASIDYDPVDDGWGPPGTTIPPPLLGAIPGGEYASGANHIPVTDVDSAPLIVTPPAPPEPARGSPSLGRDASGATLVRALEEATSRAIDLIRGLETASDRDEIITMLIAHLATTHQRAGFFAVKNGELSVFQMVPKPAVMPTASLRLDRPSTLQDVVGTRLPYRGPMHDDTSRMFLASALGAAPPEILLVPVAIRERVVGVLFGEHRLAHTFDDQLALAARAAGMSLEKILRTKRS